MDVLFFKNTLYYCQIKVYIKSQIKVYKNKKTLYSIS